MKIELHLLQNFAPSNLNRDDTGSPKDCEFGGVRRGRISSQCLKRAVRTAFQANALFKPEDLAVRTKRLVSKTAACLKEIHGRNEEEASTRVTAALAACKLKVVEDNKTQYLLYLPSTVITQLGALVHQAWDELAASGEAGPGSEPSSGAVPKATNRRASSKVAAQEAVPKELRDRIESIVARASRTPDLALFGRMIADNADWNVDAACQVAHAITTNRLAIDFDFYTAVDDFRPDDNQGSDMMGTVALHGSCFYRYAVIDVGQLEKNLEDKTLVRGTIEAFLKSSITAIPTGKQNGTAAHNPPSYVLAVVRETGMPVSLANAFAQPVRPDHAGDLVQRSIEKLEAYLGKTAGMLPDPYKAAASCADREYERPAGEKLPGLKHLDSTSAVIAEVMKCLPPGAEA